MENNYPRYELERKYIGVEQMKEYDNIANSKGFFFPYTPVHIISSFKGLQKEVALKNNEFCESFAEFVKDLQYLGTYKSENDDRLDTGEIVDYFYKDGKLCQCVYNTEGNNIMAVFINDYNPLNSKC